MNTTQIGDITEHRFILYCLERNIPVCKPVSNNLPYDCIIELHGKLLRIQVKTGYDSSADSFVFNTRSTTKNYSEVKAKEYDGRADYFVTWSPHRPEKFYAVKVEDAPGGMMRLWLKESSHKLKSMASDFDIEKIIAGIV